MKQCKRVVPIDENMTPDLIREMGKQLLFDPSHDGEKRSEGLNLIIKAHTLGDLEASFWIGRFILDGILKVNGTDPTEHALTLMLRAADGGCIQARAYLNTYCNKRYSEMFEGEGLKGPLVDFDGQPIKINKQGLFTPVDAVLQYEDGKSVLTLSTNVKFVYTDDLPEVDRFEDAIVNGIRAWAGEYTVFGGQPLTVRVEVTRNEQLLDNLVICPVTDNIIEALGQITNTLLLKKAKTRVAKFINQRRSFAVNSFKWTAHSGKSIFIHSDDGRFDDYVQLMNAAKHEFGHIIGLGDLYRNEEDGLGGVNFGTYAELDCYAVSQKIYNLVMCDSNGPISNNDIEMVVLAYKENKMQLYQPEKFKRMVSEALGRGN